MKEILITNDDGFEALGINELAKALSRFAKVTVVAPSSEKSGTSHSMTITKPLRLIEISENFYKLDDATPADCVHIALDVLYKNKKLPDLVISGINHGSNIAEDITYSGTCGAAMEASLLNIPSMAISQFYEKDSLKRFGFDLACEVASKLTQKILNERFPLGDKRFLNVNIPAICKDDFRGCKVVSAGKRIYSTKTKTNYSPRGYDYHWVDINNFDFDLSENEGRDLGVLFKGYASITPIKLDLTSYNDLALVEEWIK